MYANTILVADWCLHSTEDMLAIMFPHLDDPEALDAAVAASMEDVMDLEPSAPVAGPSHS